MRISDWSSDVCSSDLSAVLPLDGTGKGWRRSVPDDAQRLIIDAPAGAMRGDLDSFLEHADAPVVPVLPSSLDIDATVPFPTSLPTHPRIPRAQLRVGPVANNTQPYTTPSQPALALLAQRPYPVLAHPRA